MDFVSLLWPALAFVVIAAGAAALRGRYLTPQGKITRDMRRVPRAPLAGSATDEPRRFVGRVVALGETFESPVEQRDCVAFTSVVAQSGPGVGPTESARRVLVESREADFLLDDGSCRLHVRVEHATMVLVPLSITARFDALPAGVRRLLEERGVSRGRLSLLGRKVVVREGALVVGERAAVVGRKVSSPPNVAEGESRRSLVLEGSKAAPLFVSNDPSVLR